MKRNWIILLAVLAAVTAVLLGNRMGKDSDSPAASGVSEPRPGATSEALPASAPKKGSAAPSFELASLDGKTSYKIGGERAKVLVVNFWASWCGPCDREAPDLVALYDKYKDRMDLYAVNATNYDRLRNAREFVKEKAFTFPVLTDAEGTAGDAYKVFSYPTSFIVGRDGRILERIEGTIPLATWEQYLDEATKES
ncbi:redoxin domain-containing protein [Cohnella sp. CFH 77786]|uniref:TlpA family protein disulfide reductase n=1 Tax=Cohnella sp. CFH 77786 TaxID=2662265 RepID=UPI001C60AE9F|nr:TlpA disulfide reductase family protein [Cohnella sp. CFH 77786]MBW5445096.1 redoxin domain-containing protein [Cohnella sp. CFH 77786]